jgi:hypothetical protein
MKKMNQEKITKDLTSQTHHRGGFFISQGIYCYENHYHEKSVRVNQREL